jgi:hypothetical protein
VTSRLARASLALGALLVIGGGALAVDRGLAGRPAGADSFRAVPVVDLGPAPASGAAPETRPSGAGLPTGSTLTLSRLGVHAAITAVAVVQGVMQVPADPRVVGWWSGGGAPTQPRGSVVVVGHVNYAGVPGALGRLPDTRLGDDVSIVGPGLDARYRVTAVRTYPKSSGIPAAAFGPGPGDGRLVLITCGGPFDSATGNYEDNIVAYAARR